MTQITKGAITGFAFAQMWTVKDCYSYGQLNTDTAVSTPATSHAYLIRDPKTSGVPQISREVLTLTGGDTIKGARMFGPSSIDSFQITTTTLDADLVALVTRTSVDQTTNDVWSEVGFNYGLGNLPNVGLSLHANFQTIDESCDTLQKWFNLIFPSCQISPQYPTPSFQAEADMTWQVQPSMVGKRPNGDAFDSNLGLENNQDLAYAIISDYPVALTTWFADGIATTFNTAYRPMSTTVTVNSTQNHFAVNGTPTALTSIVIASGLATAAAAGSDGDVNVLMYETQFKAVS
jgi:hypothetical protein